GLGDSDINIINLSTISDNNEDKLEISSEYFYSPEILSVLFGATEQTQKPFIKRLLSRMEYANENGWGIQNWLPHLFAKSLVHSSREVFEYIKEIIDYLSKN